MNDAHNLIGADGRMLVPRLSPSEIRKRNRNIARRWASLERARLHSLGRHAEADALTEFAYLTPNGALIAPTKENDDCSR